MIGRGNDLQGVVAMVEKGDHRVSYGVLPGLALILRGKRVGSITDLTVTK
jgi:hypothetical protein